MSNFPLFKNCIRQSSSSSLLSTIASKYNHAKLQERAATLQKIKSLLSQATNTDDDSSLSPLEREKLAQTYESLYQRQIKLSDPQFERLHRNRLAEFRIPFTWELNSSQWQKYNGLQLLHRSLEHFQIVPKILSPKQLAFVRLNLCVGWEKRGNERNEEEKEGNQSSSVFVSRGSLIHPWHVLKKPSILKCEFGEENLSSSSLDGGKISLVLVDLDYPSVERAEKINYILWKLDDIPNDGNCLLFHQARESISFQAPHPFRGTDYHKFAFMLLQSSNNNNNPIKKEREEVVVKEEQEQQREFDFSTVGPENDYLLLGFCFFRTTWSKHVGEYLRKTQGKDPVFGKVASIFLNEEPKSSKFKYS